MKLFLDTADPQIIRNFWQTGILSGVTTNPVIMQACKMDAPALCKQLDGWFSGILFLQASGLEYMEIINHARFLNQLMHGKIVVKIPSIIEGFKAIATLEKEGIATAATALFTSMQGICAAEAGASVIIPFYDRLERSGENPLYLLKNLVQIQNSSKKTKVLVASLKNLSQVEKCFESGAWGVTIPPQVFSNLWQSPLTDDAVKIFQNACLHKEE